MKIVSGTFFLLMAGSGSIFCVIIVFIQKSFGSITEVLGIFGAFLGCGLFAGTIAFGKFGQKLSKIRSIFINLIFCGIAINLFAFYANLSPSFIIGGVFVFLIGLTMGPIMTCINTLMHELIPDEARGRIFSSMEAVIHLAFLVFMFLTAYLSKHISNMTIIATSGVVFSIIGLAGYLKVKAENL